MSAALIIIDLIEDLIGPPTQAAARHKDFLGA